MAGAGIVAHAWKEYGIQALVLLSFTLQLMLLILAELRRCTDSGVVRFFVWSAYMMADATAIYVLGHLSVTTRSPKHELLAFWAPFLLLHLGGQDRITAYAIEDNQLWLRHLQTLAIQVAAAAYVIYGSSIVVGNGRPLLLSATILMFVVGVVKYGERVWALRCAGSSPTGNYHSDIGKRRLNLVVPEAFTSRLDPESFLLSAHLLLDFAKDKFKGPLPRLFLYVSDNSPGSQMHGEDVLYKVAEMQLSLLHDVFYTKAEVTHTWASRRSRIARWVGVEDWWNALACSWSIPVSARIKELLLEGLRTGQWGREELESRGLGGDLAWIAESRLEERILAWHIATEIFLSWYQDQEQPEGGDAGLVEAAQALSNYMLFLLGARPHMLPPDVSRDDYVVLCYALTYHMDCSSAEDLLSQLQGYADALRTNSESEFKLRCKNTNRLGDKALKGGCSLGAFLVDRGGSPVGGTLEMICQAWAQMLCSAGDKCSVSSHAKQLSSGGELLTVAALVAKYMRSFRLSACFRLGVSERTKEW